MSDSWLWNINKTEAEVKRILADSGDEKFVYYAALLLSRHGGLPKAIFKEYIRKEDFLIHWPAIKRRMRKDSQNRDRVLFWSEVYDYLIRSLKEKGTPFVRSKAAVCVDPEQRKVGQMIRKRRRSRKMTQADLARKTGLTQQHIAKIEKGSVCPRLATMRKIEKALGLEIGTQEGFLSGQACITLAGNTSSKSIM